MRRSETMGLLSASERTDEASCFEAESVAGDGAHPTRQGRQTLPDRDRFAAGFSMMRPYRPARRSAIIAAGNVVEFFST
jgi:hypothetical protein